MSKENIIHRNLKPSNILFDKSGGLKLIDFEFAKYIDHKETPSVGSYGYKSPEVFVGDYKNLSKCDVWSLGIMMYQLLYGSFPWTPEIKCDYQFYEESKKALKFPKYPKVSLRMKQLIFELLTHDQKKRPNWNEVIMRMNKLGFLREVTPLKLSRTKVDISKYYVSTMEDSGGENKNEDKKFSKNELVGTPKKKSRTKVDLSKYYELTTEDSDGENKNETNPKMKNRCGFDERTTFESINVELNLANFFGNCVSFFEQNTSFLLKDQNSLRKEILDYLDRFAKNFYSNAKKKLKSLKKVNPDLDELKTLEKKIKNNEFYSVEEEINDQPNYEEFRLHLKKFLKAH